MPKIIKVYKIALPSEFVEQVLAKKPTVLVNLTEEEYLGLYFSRGDFSAYEAKLKQIDEAYMRQLQELGVEKMPQARTEPTGKILRKERKPAETGEVKHTEPKKV